MTTSQKSVPPITPKKLFRLNDTYSTIGEQLGKGSYANVYKGINNHTKEPVAIKEIDVSMLVARNQNLRKHLYQEIQIMERVSHHNHPNILRMHKSIEMRTPSNGVYLYIVLDFCDEDLQSYLAKQPFDSRKRVKEPVAKRFLQQFASGLAYLRSLEISHRDLKPQNLLLKHEKNGGITLKIADFGFARYIEPQGLADTMCGTPLYMAPEILERVYPYTSKADLWSVGIILYEMLCGTTPFNASTLDELIKELHRKPITFPERIRFSDECKTLIVALLRKDPAQRISWEDFWRHNWFGPGNFPDVPKQLLSSTQPPYNMDEKPRPVQPGVNLYKPDPAPATKEDSEDYEAALAVLGLGDTYHENLDFGRALTLYLKGLNELKNLYQSNRNSKSSLACNIQDSYLRYMQKCSTLVHEKKVYPVDTPEYLIFQAARRLGREGATAEMAKMYEDSFASYQQGYLLIQQMLLDSKSIDFPIIKDFKNGFLQRLEAIKETQAREADA